LSTVFTTARPALALTKQLHQRCFLAGKAASNRQLFRPARIMPMSFSTHGFLVRLFLP